MIQATELRLNNWVRFYEADQDSDLEGFVKVIRIEEGEFYAELDYVHPNPKTVVYEPIPLSPDILEKCGFEKDRNGWQLPGTQFSLTESFYPCWMDKMLWPQDVEEFKHLSLKHLHQLQNLILDLTQTALTLNL